MSEIATDLVWSESESRRGSRLVLLALAREADDQCRATLTLEDISRLTGLTVRSITTCLGDLASLGEISRERGGGAFNPSSYAILLGKASGATAHAGTELPTSGPGVPQSGDRFSEGDSRKAPSAPSSWKSLHGDSEVSSSRARGGYNTKGGI